MWNGRRSRSRSRNCRQNVDRISWPGDSLTPTALSKLQCPGDPEEATGAHPIGKSCRLLDACLREVAQCFAFAGVSTIGASACVSRRWQQVAASEEAWRPLLVAHWPGCQWLPGALVASRATYARRVQLARDARQQEELRDSHRPRAFAPLTEATQKYTVLLELAADGILVGGGCFDLQLNGEGSEAFLSAPVRPNMPVHRKVSDLRISITLVRKEDQKLLVIGDCLEIAFANDDDAELCLCFGSSPVTSEVDELFAVLSRDPLMSSALEGSSNLAFRHDIKLIGVTWGSDLGAGRLLQALGGVQLGMHEISDRIGRGDDKHDLEPPLILAVWERIATWG